MNPAPPSRSLTNRLFDWLFGRDFFISYRWSDGRDYAVKLAQRLKAEGFDCFLDSDGFIKGDDWRPTGDREIRKTSRLVLLGTPDIHASEAVARELAVFGRKKGRLIAVEFGDALSWAKHPDSPVLANLDPHIIRHLEPLEAMQEAPSEDLIQELRRTFTVETTAARRRRVIRIVTATLTILFITAVVLAVVANDQRQKAVARQIEVTRNLAEARWQLGQSVKGAPYAGKESVIQSVHQYLHAAQASDEILDLPSRDTAITAATFTGNHLLQSFPHDTRINDLTFSADDRLMLAWEWQAGRATLWNLQNGDLISRPVQDAKDLSQAVLSPDGQLVLTWGRSNTLQLLRATDGVAVGNPVRHEKTIHLAVFSPDSSLVFSWSDEGLAQIWKTADGSILQQINDLPTLSGSRAEFNAKGNCLVAADYQNMPKLVWLTTDGFETCKSLWNEGMSSPWCFSPDGGQLLISTQNQGIRRWHTATGRDSDFIKEDAAAASFSPNGKQVVTYIGKQAILWNAADGKPVGEPMTHDGINHLDPVFSPDGRFVATWSEEDMVIQLWNAADASPAIPGVFQKTFRHDGDAVRSAMFSADGQTLLTLSSGAKIWRVDVGYHHEMEPRITEEGVMVSGARFTREGKLLTWDEDGGRVRLWNAPRIHTESKKLPGRWKCVLSQDGRQMLAWNGNSMQQRDIVSGETFGPVMNHEQEIQGAAISPDGALALSWTTGNKVWLWRLADGSAIGSPIEHSFYLDAAAFQQSADKLVTLSYREDEFTTEADGPNVTYFTELWESQDGWKTRQLTRTSEKRFLNLSGDRPKLVQDGKSVLLFSEEAKVITIWDMVEDKAVGTPVRLRQPCEGGACLSPDGTLLLASHRGFDTAGMWSVSDGLPYGRELKAGNISATFSPCGRYVLQGGEPGGIWTTQGQRLLTRFDLDILWDNFQLAGGCRTLIARTTEDELYLSALPQPRRDTVADLIMEFEVRSASTLEETGNLRPLRQWEWEERRARLARSASKNMPP